MTALVAGPPSHPLKAFAASIVEARWFEPFMQTPNFIKLAGPAAEGAMASVPGLAKEKMPGGETFLKKFKARFNADVELFAPMGYDAVMVLIDAMESGSMRLSAPSQALLVNPEVKRAYLGE